MSDARSNEEIIAYEMWMKLVLTVIGAAPPGVVIDDLEDLVNDWYNDGRSEYTDEQFEMIHNACDKED